MPPVKQKKQTQTQARTKAPRKTKKNLRLETAKELHVPQYINSCLESLETAGNRLAEVYQAYGPAYYKAYGLTAAHKAAAKAFELVEKAEKLTRANEFYDPDAGPWTGVFNK